MKYYAIAIGSLLGGYMAKHIIRAVREDDFYWQHYPYPLPNQT